MKTRAIAKLSVSLTRSLRGRFVIRHAKTSSERRYRGDPPPPNGSFQHFHVCGGTQRGDTLVSSSETSLTGLDCLTGARHALIGRDFLPGRLA